MRSHTTHYFCFFNWFVRRHILIFILVETKMPWMDWWQRRNHSLQSRRLCRGLILNRSHFFLGLFNVVEHPASLRVPSRVSAEHFRRPLFFPLKKKNVLFLKNTCLQAYVLVRIIFLNLLDALSGHTWYVWCVMFNHTQNTKFYQFVLNFKLLFESAFNWCMILKFIEG